MDSNLARKISEQSAERLWFVARGTVLKGPFSTTQVIEKIQKKEFSFMDFCWCQGFNEWRPMGSIEDFDRRSKLRRLPQYPLVEVPASSNGGIYLKDTSPPEGENVAKSAFLKSLPTRKRQPQTVVKGQNNNAAVDTHRNGKFEVVFAKTKRLSITIYEWGLAVIFAVVLAYFAADYALREVARALNQNLGTYVAGSLDQRGVEVAHSVAPQFWAPLLSANSLKEFQPLEKSISAGLPAALELPVVFTGHIEQDSSTHDQLQVSGYEIKSAASLNLWSPKDVDLDPVYIRPIQIHGYLRLENANQVLVPHRQGVYLDP